MTVAMLRSRLGRLARDEAGSPTVEFAMTAPALLLLVFGVIQFGMAITAYAGVRNAVEVGARYATVYQAATGAYPTDDAIRTKVTANVFGVSSGSLGTPTVAHCTSSGSNCVDVTLTYPITLNLGIISFPTYTMSYTQRAYQQ